jgi:hypothetical protein
MTAHMKARMNFRSCETKRYEISQRVREGNTQLAEKKTDSKPAHQWSLNAFVCLHRYASEKMKNWSLMARA